MGRLHVYVDRISQPIVKDLLDQFPVVAIVGTRQCGKSTLAKHLLSKIEKNIYLDLELPSDLRMLNDPERFLSLNTESLVCVDEVQRKPELFSVIRAICDRTNRPGQFLILGSASPSLEDI